MKTGSLRIVLLLSLALLAGGCASMTDPDVRAYLHEKTLMPRSARAIWTGRWQNCDAR